MLWAPPCGPTQNLVPELLPTKWWLTGIYVLGYMYLVIYIYVVELAKMNLKASLKSESRTEHELWTRSEDFFPECVKVTGVRKIHPSWRVYTSHPEWPTQQNLEQTSGRRSVTLTVFSVGAVIVPCRVFCCCEDRMAWGAGSPYFLQDSQRTWKLRASWHRLARAGEDAPLLIEGFMTGMPASVM